MRKQTNPITELQETYDLLQLEYNYEKEQYEEQTRQSNVLSNVERGSCWYPIQLGRSYHNSINQYILEIEKLDLREIDHDFDPGKPLRFFIKDKNNKPVYLDFTAQVSYVDENRMMVVLPHTQALAQLNQTTELGVQLYFDETSYKTMFAALAQVATAKDSRLAFLRDVLLGNKPASFRESFPIRFPWLNISQDEAVNKVLNAKETAIIHGPPGTGKTTTLVEAIYETLHRESQVMVCAQSNTAVDWICEKLVDRGVNVLRIGNPSRVNDKMLSFTYERQFESHPHYSELWSIRKMIREVSKGFRKSGENREALRNRLNKLRSRATELEIAIEQAIFSEARVIASTLIGANNRVLNHRKFSTLFIDEAAQALEAACWVPVSKAERVIFAGDHCQLPPTIKCFEAARKGLAETLMQKIAERKPEVCSLLKIQYRMHQDIMQFSSDYFYKGQLEAHTDVKYRSVLSWDTPLVWINTSRLDVKEESGFSGKSRLNKEEAEQLIKQLISYVGNIGRERILNERIDFGIISPYKAQVYYLRKRIKQIPLLRPLRKYITINTVDGFQGQERDVIFISLVRANDNGNIGFLSDLRRMNVAITRARMKLFVLGDADTLTAHPFYDKLYQYFEDKGEIEYAAPEEDNNEQAQ
ncbi:MAG: AAA domain-containing protein [Bacteroidales bacterium]